MSEVTIKSTKQQILDAYEEAKKKLDAMEAATDDPRAQIKKAESERIEASAKGIIDMSILSEEIISQYQDLCADIETKKAELKELYGIDAQINSMVALINSQKAIQAELKEQSESIKAEREEKLQAQYDEWNTKIEEKKAVYEGLLRDLESQYNAQKTELSVKRKRESEEYEYNLNRQRQIENDRWADEKAAREKEMSNREAALKEIESKVAEKINSIVELEDKVKAIPTLIENATAEGKKAGKAEAEKSHVFELRAINQKNEYEVQSLEDKLERLIHECEDKDCQIASLQEKLDNAYAQMRELAAETVKSTGGVKILNHENSSK